MQTLPRGKSSLLHAIRWVSATFVLLGHIDMVATWIGGAELMANGYLVAHMSVISFFVVSGFTIAYVTERTPSFKSYAVDRATRIYSVLIPAVLFTVLLDQFGALYAQEYYKLYSPDDRWLIRFVVNIVGLQGWQNHRVQFGTNASLWSIGYEVFFYAIWGIWFYKIGHRISRPKDKRQIIYTLAVLALTILAGRIVSLYIVIWLLGVASYCALKNELVSKGFASLAIAFCVMVLGSSALNFGFAQDFVFALIVALLLASSFSLPCFCLNERLSGFSFSLYATHLPVVFFIYAVFYNEVNVSDLFAVPVFFSAIFVAIVFSIIFEKSRLGIRNCLLGKVLRTDSVSKSQIPS